MKKFFKIVLVICLTVCVIPFNKVSAKEAFDILEHDYQAVVNQDGMIEIKETMKVHFTERYKHGIYVNIPYKYEIDWNFLGINETRKYIFPVSDLIEINGHEYSTELADGNMSLRIGSEDEYANEYETYIFTYKLYTGDLDLDGLQALSLIIASDGWDTTTDKCTFSIEMPKDFDANSIQIHIPNGSLIKGTGQLDGLTVETIGNTIKGEYNRKIQADEFLSISLALPDDYFHFNDLNKMIKPSIIISSALLFILTIIYFLFGKDDEVIPTVEFKAPDGLNAAEIGYIIDETIDNRDMIALILDWGRKGIIRIEETEDNLVLTKLRELDKDAKEHEKIYFAGIFSDCDCVNVEDFSDEYASCLAKAKNSLVKEFKNTNRQLSTTISKILEIVYCCVCFVPLTLYYTLMMMGYYHNFEYSLFTIFMAIILIFSALLAIFTSINRYSQGKILLGVIAFVLYLIPVVVTIVTAVKLKVSIYDAIVICLIQGCVIFLTSIVRKRTKYGNKMVGKIIGFKDFIVNAKGSELEAISEENPYYFYDILPYAYALGLSEIWNEHFSQIRSAECDWYSTYHETTSNYYLFHSLESRMHYVESCSASSSSSSSSSSSGFGGSSGGSW